MSASGPARHDSSAHHVGGYFGPGPGGTCLAPGDPKAWSRPSRRCARSCPDAHSNHLERRNVPPGRASQLRRTAGPEPQPGCHPDRASRPGCAVLDAASRAAPAHRWVTYYPLFWISLMWAHACGGPETAAHERKATGLSPRRDVCNIHCDVCKTSERSYMPPTFAGRNGSCPEWSWSSSSIV